MFNQYSARNLIPYDLQFIIGSPEGIRKVNKKRKCALKGCKQVLSSYNLGTFCFVHSDKELKRGENCYYRRLNAHK